MLYYPTNEATSPFCWVQERSDGMCSVHLAWVPPDDRDPELIQAELSEQLGWVAPLDHPTCVWHGQPRPHGPSKSAVRRLAHRLANALAEWASEVDAADVGLAYLAHQAQRKAWRQEVAMNTVAGYLRMATQAVEEVPGE